jgi:hypothetical protein
MQAPAGVGQAASAARQHSSLRNGPPNDAGLGRQFARIGVEIDRRIPQAKLAAGT